MSNSRTRRHQSGPYHVQIENSFSESGYIDHDSFKSRKKAIEVADTIAKSGELARVRYIDPSDGESIPVHVSDPTKLGYLFRYR